MLSLFASRIQSLLVHFFDVITASAGNTFVFNLKLFPTGSLVSALVFVNVILDFVQNAHLCKSGKSYLYEDDCTFEKSLGNGGNHG